MDNPLRILKRRLPVTLWVHPEGRVVGNIFLHLGGGAPRDGEAPWSVLNEPADFLVVERRNPEETRFYNKHAIVRVDYVDPILAEVAGTPLMCRVTLMDGLLLEGEICKAMPEERSRLYDYLNETRDRFLELCLAGGQRTLINKNYVVSISPRDASLASHA
jgi:hypothetical protein